MQHDQTVSTTVPSYKAQRTLYMIQIEQSNAHIPSQNTRLACKTDDAASIRIVLVRIPRLSNHDASSGRQSYFSSQVRWNLPGAAR